MLKQRTLRNSIKAVGIGLHTGKNINMELIPSDINTCLLYTSHSPRDSVVSRMPSSA